MEYIRIRNLRSLVDTGEIHLKPITLLVGHNSSGKSTFLRTFPLLRQSVEARTTGPLLWYGRLVDFGNFTDALSQMVSEEEITFEFKFRSRITRNRVGQSLGDLLDTRLALTFIAGARPEATRLNRLEISLADQEIEMKLDGRSRVTSLTVNGRDFSSPITNFRYSYQNSVIPTLMRMPTREADTQLSIADRATDELRHRLFTQIQSITGTENDTQVAEMLLSLFVVSDSESMLSIMTHRKLLEISAAWFQSTRNWNIQSEEFRLTRDLVVANALVLITRDCARYLSMFASSVVYIAPVRATAERYYRFQGLAVDEVDFQGQNLAMFLRNLNSQRLSSFSAWTDEVFGFTIETSSVGGHVSLRIKEGASDVYYNLADMGFGFSQLLPVITQLWVLIDRGRFRHRAINDEPVTIIYAIEQPELHLHPRLQAKLADAFLAAIRLANSRNLDLRLIIETHSETMVNRFGHRVARGDLDADEINLVLFTKEKPDVPTDVSIGRYTGEGILENWPYGFFEPDDI